MVRRRNAFVVFERRSYCSKREAGGALKCVDGRGFWDDQSDVNFLGQLLSRPCRFVSKCPSSPPSNLCQSLFAFRPATPLHCAELVAHNEKESTRSTFAQGPRGSLSAYSVTFGYV